MRKHWVALFMLAVAAAAWAVMSYESDMRRTGSECPAARCSATSHQAPPIVWTRPLDVDGVRLGMSRDEVRRRAGEPDLTFDYERDDIERWVYRSGLEVMFYAAEEELRVDEVLGSCLTQEGRCILVMGDATERAAERIRQPGDRWSDQFLEVRARDGRITRLRMTAGERRQLQQEIVPGGGVF